MGITHFDIFARQGVYLMPAPSDKFWARREAGVQPMKRMLDDGKPALVIGHKCKMLRRALRGGYHFIDSQGGDPEPNKRSRYSHVADAFCYLLLGAGEGMIAGTEGNEIMGNDAFVQQAPPPETDIRAQMTANDLRRRM